MYRLKLVQAALLAVPLVALGCGRQRADTRETSRETAPALPGGGAAVSTVQLGSQVGGDGSLAMHGETFRKGEPIIAALDATSLKAGSTVRLTWAGPQSQVIAQEEMMVPPDARTITFKAQDTTSWTPGTYRVDVNGAGSKTFTIE